MRRHALLLLACPRSGATALAGALVRAGADAGTDFVASPLGEKAESWQCAPLVALNERLLALLGMRWDSLVSPPDRWLERPAVRALTADADALIATQFGTATHVVLHDARLALTAPFWRERLAAADFEVTAVLMIRRPVEVAASLSRPDPVAPEKSLALEAGFNRQAGAFASQHGVPGTAGSGAHADFELGRATMLLPDFHDAGSFRQALLLGEVEARLSSPFVHFTSRYAVWVKKLYRRMYTA